jgi:hypothetical protein
MGLCDWMESIIRKRPRPIELQLSPSVSDAEADLFSPTGRRLSGSRSLSADHSIHKLRSQHLRTASPAGEAGGVEAKDCAPAPVTSPALVSPQFATAEQPAAVETAGARGAGTRVLIEGPVLKRNRWNAWQPRWATVTDDGLFYLTRAEGEPPSLLLRTSELGFKIATPTDNEPAAMLISAPAGKKLKISASEEALLSWARALGTRRGAAFAAAAA